jgi:hypothetical protein
VGNLTLDAGFDEVGIHHKLKNGREYCDALLARTTVFQTGDGSLSTRWQAVNRV